MIELARNHGLLLEALHKELIAEQFRVDHFERAQLAKQHVIGFVNRTHPSLAHLRENAVLPANDRPFRPSSRFDQRRSITRTMAVIIGIGCAAAGTAFHYPSRPR